ncbi:fimbrial protein [Serratia marcescens]|uniref:fimbrial protein n=1 Tax=Serratia marcescens TaxID=615 RepID=UPI0034D5BBBE
MRQGAIAMLLCGVLLSCYSVQAAEQVEMRLRGTLRVPPPCKISDGGTLEVNFGDRIGIKKVDGVNYRQAIDYRIRCESPGALPWEMQLTLKGVATTFDLAAVQTDNADLGIRIYRDAVPFTLNSSMKIDPASPPRIEAVPVAKPGVSLAEGKFAATAMLQVEYL